MIPQEEVASAVFGVVHRNGLREGSPRLATGAAIVVVLTDIEIEITITIEITGGDPEAIPGIGKALSHSKTGFAFVFKKHNAHGCGEDGITIAVAIEIEKKSRRSVVENVEARPSGFHEASLFLLKPKAVSQAADLAEVDIFKPIAIDIRNRNSGLSELVRFKNIRDALPPLIIFANEIRVRLTVFRKKRTRQITKKRPTFQLHHPSLADNDFF